MGAREAAGRERRSGKVGTGARAAGSSLPLASRPHSTARKKLLAREIRDVRDGKCTGGAALWGNLVFKTHERALWVFFLPAAEAEGPRGEVARSCVPKSLQNLG